MDSVGIEPLDFLAREACTHYISPPVMTTIEKLCPICNTTFQASLTEHNRGNARVCSRLCAHRSASLRNIKHKEPNVKCSYCNKLFYISDSKRKNSKSGLHFCCKKHKDLAQRVENGFFELHPTHYGSGRTGYRAKAFYTYGEKCQLCGYDRHPGILQVHHKDKDRNNNQIENLLVCCPNCHAEQHLVEGVLSFHK